MQPTARSLGYATAELNRRPRWLTALGILGLCFGLTALVVNAAAAYFQESRLLSARAELARWSAPAAPVSTRKLTAPSVAGARSFAALSATQARQVVAVTDQELQTRGSALTPSQRQGLVAELQRVGQPMVDPALPMPTVSTSGPRYPRQRVFAMQGPSRGTVLLTFRQEYAQIPDQRYSAELDINGQLVARDTSSASPTAASSGGSPPPGYLQEMKGRVFAAAVFIGTAVVFFTLALLLCTAGVALLLGNTAWGVPLHVWYARAKLTAVALNALSAVLQLDGSDSAVFAPIGVRAVVWMLSCIYPLILLQSFRKRSRSSVTAGGEPNWYTGIGIASVMVAATSLVIYGQVLCSVWATAREAAATAAQQNQTMADYTAAVAAERVAERLAAAHPPRALTLVETTAVVRQILLVHTLTPPQVRTLTAVLQKPGQWLIDPSLPVQGFEDRREIPPNGPAYQNVVSQIMNNGEVVLDIWHRRASNDHGVYAQVTIEKNGLLQFTQIDSPAGRDTFTANDQGGGHEMSYTTLPNVNARDRENAVGRATAATFAIGVSCIDLLLSVTLLIAGMSMLWRAGAATGVKLHAAYAGLQIVVAIVGAFVFSQVTTDNNPGSDVGDLQAIATGVAALASAIYPGVLLVLLLGVLRRGRDDEGAPTG